MIGTSLPIPQPSRYLRIMAHIPNRLATAAFTVALLLVSAVSCDTLAEKKAGDSGGGPQNVGQNTGNKLSVP